MSVLVGWQLGAWPDWSDSGDLIAGGPTDFEKAMIPYYNFGLV